MKPGLFFLFICFCIGCSSSTQKMTNKSTNDLQMGNIYIGMSLSEFKESVPNNNYVLFKGNLTIYKSNFSEYIKRTDTISKKPIRDQFRYFYFIDDELINIDEGSDVSNYRMGIK